MLDWLTSLDSAFWLWLDRASILLSFFVVASIAAFVYQVWYVRKHRRQLKKLAGTTDRPRALALTAGGGSIAEPVRVFLNQLYPESQIDVKEYDAGEVTEQNVIKHLDALRHLKEEMQSEGVSELHLFVRAPLALAVATGSIFDNWSSVKVYQNNREGQYEPWFTLQQAKAPPVAEALVERIHETLDPHADSSKGIDTQKSPPITQPALSNSINE